MRRGHQTFGPDNRQSAGGGTPVVACDDPPEDVLPASGIPDPGTSPNFSRCDHVHALDASVITGYLAELYALGVINNPVTRNTLVGTQHSTWFTPQGYVEISQTDNDNSGSYDLRLRRHDIQFQGTNRAQFALYTKFDFVGGLNTSGGTGFDSILEDENDNQNLFSQYQAQLDVVNGAWYRPQFDSIAQPVTFSRYLQVNRRNIGVQANWYVNSDGVEWIVGRFPSGTPRQLGHVWSIDFADDTGPPNGSAYGVRVTGPAGSGPGIFQSAEVCSFFGVLDDQNFGSREAVGHWEWYCSGPTLAGADEHTLALQLYPPNTAILSPADAPALSYDKTADKLRLSVNAGAYSPILTAADIAPTTASALVDIVSASTDFKTAGTVVVVPTVARRFLPVAAYIEFTTVAALTVGPSVKLGNDGGHTNVAPVLAVANTVITDNAIPFVMALDPVVIDLTTTGIIAELTVNATATTATGRLHVLGVYL